MKNQQWTKLLVMADEFHRCAKLMIVCQSQRKIFRSRLSHSEQHFTRLLQDKQRQHTSGIFEDLEAVLSVQWHTRDATLSTHKNVNESNTFTSDSEAGMKPVQITVMI